MECLDRVGLARRARSPGRACCRTARSASSNSPSALATAPKLLLLDEPLAGTGHEESQRVVETLRRLKGRYTIVLVEHDMEAVFSLADRVSVLVYGRVIATGTPEAIRANAEVRSRLSRRGGGVRVPSPRLRGEG